MRQGVAGAFLDGTTYIDRAVYEPPQKSPVNNVNGAAW